MKDNKVYLKDILDAIYLIELWLLDADFENFSDDRGLLQSSIIRQLEVIGEVAARVRGDFATQYPEIPWTKIVDMRNRLIHEYNMVDLDLTWGVVTKELPILKKQLENILNEG